jgi:hypothetical protein
MSRHTTSRPPYFSRIALIALFLCNRAGAAQTTSPSQSPPVKDPDSQIVTSVPANQNDDFPTPAHNTKATPAQKADEAWSMLSTAVTSPKHVELRIQALAALGTLGPNPRGIQMIMHAMEDTNLDVRTAAILAAGQTGSRSLTTRLRTLLDDKEPQVAYAAALTLWKMNDRSGEDILIAVVDGERSANPTMINGTRQNIARSLRNPGQLARFGALEGAAMFLGPFGFGIAAYEYMRKNGGDTARVTATEQLSQEKTTPVRKTLIDALADKDVAVRAAAAKALGSYHEPDASDALFNAFIDTKAPVRLTAAAAYINSTTQSTAAPKRSTRH